MTEALEKYGLPGVVIGGLAWFVLYLMKQHREERKEMAERMDKQIDDTNKTIRENTNILSGLKALLESRR